MYEHSIHEFNLFSNQHILKTHILILLLKIIWMDRALQQKSNRNQVLETVHLTTQCNLNNISWNEMHRAIDTKRDIHYYIGYIYICTFYMFCGRGSRVKTNYMGQTLLDIHQIYCILQLETIFLLFTFLCYIY